jgi:Asp-tRNA(Asn)/Glu-tRNA(Gln) amidotransferase A subunit family amidase
MIAYTEFEGGWKRHNMVGPLWALNLDFDKVPMAAVNGLVQYVAQTAPTQRWLIHTTYQHGCLVDAAGEPLARLRVIYPSDIPLGPAHYCAAWQEAVADFAQAGHVVDAATGNPERCWFVPAINPNAPEWARKPWVQHFERAR